MNNVQQRRGGNGFTIVELAVVIAVIGILASIVIFSFGEWRVSVAKKEVQNDLLSVKSAMHSERNFKNAYPTSLPSSVTASENVTVAYHSGTSTSYCVDGESKVVPSVTYYIKAVNGDAGEPTEGTCATS